MNHPGADDWVRCSDQSQVSSLQSQICARNANGTIRWEFDLQPPRGLWFGPGPQERLEPQFAPLRSKSPVR